MNNNLIPQTSTDSSHVSPKRGIFRNLILALASAAFAGTATAQLPPDATGYVVELHTANRSDAGTDSVIKMSLEVRDPDWALRTLGSWTLDHSDANDHERNKTDNYFFPESTATAHIEKLRLESDGKGGSPGWAWDELHVTRVERGVATWTWTWQPKTGTPVLNSKGLWVAYPGWIYGEKYAFDFTSAGWARPIPSFVKTPAGLKPEYSFATNKGSILVTQSIVTPEFVSSTSVAPTGGFGGYAGGFGGYVGGINGFSGPVVVSDQLYRISTTNYSRSVRCIETSLGNGKKTNTFITLFDNLAPGVHRIETLNPKSGVVVAYTTVEVRARTVTPVYLP